MTEDGLFAAVHRYGYLASSHDVLDWDTDSPELRVELLDAIREYVASLPVEICEPGYARWMRAKAAVCDAYLRVCDATTNWESMVVDQLRRKQLSDAVKSLREIEGSAT